MTQEELIALYNDYWDNWKYPNVLYDYKTFCFLIENGAVYKTKRRCL